MQIKSAALALSTLSDQSSAVTNTGNPWRRNGGAPRPGSHRSKKRRERFRLAPRPLDRGTGGGRPGDRRAHRETRISAFLILRRTWRGPGKDAYRSQCYRRPAKRRHVYAHDAAERSVGPHGFSRFPAWRKRRGRYGHGRGSHNVPSPAVVAAQWLDPMRPLWNGRDAASLVHARVNATHARATRRTWPDLARRS